MNKDKLLNYALEQQDRLDDIIAFLMVLPEDMPGRWSFSSAVYSSMTCRVGSMDEIRNVRRRLGNSIEAESVQTTQYPDTKGASRDWVYKAFGGKIALFLSLDPREEGSTCKLIPVDVKEVTVYEVQCEQEMKNDSR